MHISIAERIKPFDHLPGTSCVLPGSTTAVEVFPALIQFYDLSKETAPLLAKLKTNLKGPVKKFTVQLNLEKGNVLVFGESQDGYFSYSLTASIQFQSLYIKIERGADHLKFELENTNYQMHSKNLREIWISKEPHENLNPYKLDTFEKLSLGSHKSQDWTLVKRRADFKEILPVWLRLGQSIPQITDPKFTGTADLLKKCEEAIAKVDSVNILTHFETLFSVGFKSLMFPTLFDNQHLGIVLKEVEPKTSPLILLTYGAQLIRSMFASFDGRCITILKALPPSFHSGRFLHFKCENLGLIDFEWSKGKIRRLILQADKDASFVFRFQSGIKYFRLKEESEHAFQKLEVDANVFVKKGKRYFFDRFEH